MPISLFLPEEEPHGYTGEVKLVTKLVFQESLIGFLDVLRQVTKECKRWRSGIYLSNVLDLDVLAFCSGWRIMHDLREQGVVELGGGDSLVLVSPDLNRFFNDLENPLLLKR